MRTIAALVGRPDPGVARTEATALASLSPARPAARGSALPRPWFYGRCRRIIEECISRCGSSRAAQACPSSGRLRLATALDAAGRPDIGIRVRVVRTDAEATELGFTGSPTILIDGCDAFPDRHAVVGLSCRLYRSAEGCVWLTDRRAADRRPCRSGSRLTGRND